jgi:outer membrane protein assembly factor BamB
VTSSVVQWNGTSLATSYVSPTSLTANVPAADLTSPASVPVTVTNGSGAASSAPVTFVIGEQTAPMITALAPATVTAGNPAFQLVVTGTNFLSSATVQWNGGAIPTTFDSATQLTAQVTAAQAAAVASVPVTVLNDPAAGGTSNVVQLAIVAPSPVAVTSLTPAGVNAGAPTTVLTVTGSGFLTSSVVQWNGTPLTTSYVSATSLTATVPAADLTSPASVAVTVTNGSGATSSAPVMFSIGEQTAPTITALAPATVTMGNPAFQLVVTGANFLASATVRWNGSAIPTTFDSATQLTAQVTATQVAAAASVPVTVVNDAAAGATSNVVSFTVLTPTPLLPVPTLTSLSPTSVAENAQGVTLTINGANFTTTTRVSYNGILLQPTYASPTQLTVSSINTSFAVGSTISIAVTDAASGNMLSNALKLAITPPAPVLSSISPATIGAAQGAIALTVTGEYFSAASQVYFNGSARPTTLNASGALVAQLTAADVASVGTESITVEDPASGNAPSNALSLVIQALPPMTVTEVSPTTVPAGNSSFTLTVIGTGFANGSTIEWAGTSLTTTYVSSTQLRATVSAALVASTGTAQVTVVNAASQGGNISTPITVTIATPSKDAVALQMNSAHTGFITFNSVTLPAAVSWSKNVGGTPSYALIANGIVYVAVSTGSGASQLLALNGSTGATVWGPIALSGTGRIAYDSGTIFVTDGSYLATNLSAIDAATGAPLWSATTADAIEGAPPVAANGLVYTVGDGDVQAFNEQTGFPVWSGGVGGTSGTVAVTVDGVYGSSPCTAVALQPATGTVIWSANTGCEGGGGATPVVGGGEMFAPLAVGGAAYAGNIYNAESGAVLGAFGYSSLPAVTSSNIYTLSGSTLQGLSLSNNQVLWSFAGDGTLVTSPVVVNSYVFVGSSSGNLYAVNAASGAVQQTWSVGAAPTAISAGDGLLIVSAGNTVSAFVLSTNP